MSEPYDYDDRRPDPGGERWGGRPWTLVAALMVVLVVIGAGVWFLVSRDDGGDETAPAVGSSPAPAPSGGAASGGGLPEGFVGGREMVGGVPMGFAHTAEGAISAAAVWTSYAFVCPADQRAEGVATVMGADAPSVDPCNAAVPTATDIEGLSPVAVRGDVGGDSAVIEVMAMGSGDFIGSSGWNPLIEIVTVTLTWNPEAEDWRITTWNRRDLVDDSAPPITPDLFAGFQWLRPIGATLTATPFAVAPDN